LWCVTALEEKDSSLPISWFLENVTSNTLLEDAMLRAYVSPTIAILLSVPPATATTSSSGLSECSVVNVHLTDWEDYYLWRGFASPYEPAAPVLSGHGLSNPVAILLHWPLTIYYILSHMLEQSHPQTVLSVLSKRTLEIHVVGVEHELSLLPVFKVSCTPRSRTDACPPSKHQVEACIFSLLSLK
uniref:Ig-like domain-containing protein n=1 Tax=Echinostoma caproni TaxID=27848 RepID=A0A182ZZY4_9TREM